MNRIIFQKKLFNFLIMWAFFLLMIPNNVLANNNKDLQTVASADTMNTIEINLYDYTTNINDKYKTNHNYPGFQQDGGTTQEIKNIRINSFNFGNNITTDLNSYISNVTTNNPGPINKVINNANSPLSGVIKKTLGSDGYPVIKNNNNNEISLKYLFSDNTYAKKANSKNINGLFKYNTKTGAYTFNSRDNHAQWNENDNSFTLYKQIITSNFLMYPFGNFLPFNDITLETTKASTINRAYFTNIQNKALVKANNSTDAIYKNAYNTLAKRLGEFVNKMDVINNNNSNWDAGFAASQYFKAANLNKTITTESLANLYSIDFDNATNFFFGMEMKMNFIQPKNGLTGNEEKKTMVFEFSGDDDVLVYIDNILFLDLSGIHRHVGGTINFEEGKVYYYDLDPKTGDTTTLSNIISFEQILGSKGLNNKGTFPDYSSHSFKFYYMERGSGSGVMKMNFNFPLLEKNSIAVTKELDSDDKSLLGNPNFSFQILKANDTNKTNEPFINEGTKYDILDIDNSKISEGVVLKDGIFKLKANETAVFKGIEENLGSYYVREILDSTWVSQYKSVTVDGYDTTILNDIIVGHDKFNGYESKIKNISEGHTSFVYKNKVNTNKYGSLEINKNLISYTDLDSTTEFKIHVTLDGIDLPIGTNYIVNEKITKQVLEPGIIVIKANETAKINGILIGSEFKIKEILENTDAYQINYKLNGKDVSSNSVCGYINDTSTNVTVINKEKGTDLEIPINKVIKNPDGNNYIYQFELVEVTDYTGNTLVTNGTKLQLSSNTINESQITFNIKYPQSFYKKIGVYKHYYKITELANNYDKNTLYDDRVYVIEVIINNKEKEFTSNINKVWLNGFEVSDKNIEFVNQLLTEITISKEVKNIENKEDIFEFEIEIKNDENPINGEFEYKTNNGEINKITFNKGIALIKLKDNESISIYGLPYKATYKIVELIKENYTVEYQIYNNINNGNEVISTLDKNNNIKFINTYEDIVDEEVFIEDENELVDTEVLVQTGQNIWIKVFLAIVGILLILIGVICKNRKKV